MAKIPEGTNLKKPGTSIKSTASATDDTLRHLAFDNAAQANVISISSSGKIIMANRTACKLLGYSKKELLTKSRATIFAIKESSFKEMLKQRIAEGQSAALVTAIKKSGKLISCEITSAVFMDGDGIEKAITTIMDMSKSILKQKNIDTEKEKIVADNITIAKSKQRTIDTEKEKVVAGNIVIAASKQKAIDVKKDKVVADNITIAKSKQKTIDTEKEKIVADNIVLALAKSDARLAENNEWIKYIAKASYDVMWDWDIASGEIYVGDSIREVFGYKTSNNTMHFDDFCNCLLPEEKEVVQNKLTEIFASGRKTWNDSFMFKRKDGSVASTTSRASIIRDEEGKAIRLIGAIQDVSRLEDVEKKLKEQITLYEEDSQKFLLAAKLSFDIIWDWNLLTNELFIGEGFEELFGYPIKNNKGTIADLTNHIHPEDKDNIEKELSAAIKSAATSWEHVFRFIRADGSIAKVFKRASIIRHADGVAYRIIGAMQDLSRQKDLEERLDREIADKGKLIAEYKESFKLIFNSSSDILYDVDIVADKVIVSDAYEKEFGYKITENMTPADVWGNHIHPDDKEMVLKDYFRMLDSDEVEWKYNYRFLKADNSVANVLSSRIILRNADGKAYRMIGHMHDISTQKGLEKKLEQEIATKTAIEQKFKSIFNSSSDVLFDYDLVTNEIILSDAYEKEFGYKIINNITQATNWFSHVHPDDKEAVLADHNKMIAADVIEWKYSYRFLRADNSVADIAARCIIFKDASGSAYRIIGSMQDTSKQKVLEERLEQEIKLKEKQIADATEEAKETERSDIGKELHDNINQLLAASKMYIDMAKRGGENSQLYLSRSSEYTITAIEEIRKLTKGLTTDTIKTLGLGEAIDNLAKDTMEVSPVKIAYRLENFIEDSVTDKFKLNIFRIIQEQLNNILKHANATGVTIKLLQNSQSIFLTISDNGVGFDITQKRNGIGVTNMKSRAASYNGTADFISKPNEGCLLTVVFPIPVKLLNKG